MALGGGVNWTGQTTCVAGYYCYYSSEYYSQCIPGSGPYSFFSFSFLYIARAYIILNLLPSHSKLCDSKLYNCNIY